MIFYHGSLNTTGQVEADMYRNRHILVSYAAPDSIELIKELAASYIIDNGAYSIWRAGKTLDLSGFAAFVEQHAQPNLLTCIIPDVIDGTAEENDALIEAFQLPPEICMPVFHLHEPLLRLRSLLGKFRRVAIGSSGQYAALKTAPWFYRMREVFETAAEFPFSSLHGLRMLDPAIWTRFPFGSVDSATIARNWHSFPGGIHRMLRNIESATPARMLPEQHKEMRLFNES